MNTTLMLPILKAVLHLNPADAITLAALGVAALAIWLAILVVRRENSR